mmetsp:Transcript_84594/g.236772  ORF Transcript_84594/g.236772 Transcript_84594/m.236772 type:complete len:262 (-) Transcript_84594:158-943(-)
MPEGGIVGHMAKRCPSLEAAWCSSDHRGSVAACGGRQTAELHGNGGQGLHDVEGVQADVPVRRHVLLEVKPHRGAGHARAREAEDDAGAVCEDEADALVLGDAAVHGVQVLEDVVGLDLHALHLLPHERAGLVGHGLHHLLGLRLVDALVVVPCVVIPAVLLPVLDRDLLDRDEAPFGEGLRGEDLQPRQHRPHAVLLAHVVAPRAERLLAADKGRVGLLVREVVRPAVHEVPEELPPGRHLKVWQALLLRDEVQGPRGRH